MDAFDRREPQVEWAHSGPTLTMAQLYAVEDEVRDLIDTAILSATDSATDGQQYAAPRRLPAVASLIVTIRAFNQGTLLQLREAHETLGRLIACTVQLAPIDPDVLAQQLAELRRISYADGRHARLAIVDGAPPLDDFRWPATAHADVVRNELNELASSTPEWIAHAARRLLEITR